MVALLLHLTRVLGDDLILESLIPPKTALPISAE